MKKTKQLMQKMVGDNIEVLIGINSDVGNRDEYFIEMRDYDGSYRTDFHAKQSDAFKQANQILDLPLNERDHYIA